MKKLFIIYLLLLFAPDEQIIQRKRTESSTQRQAARDAALREVKERARKARDAKKAATAKTKGASKGSKAPPPKRR